MAEQDKKAFSNRLQDLEKQYEHPEDFFGKAYAQMQGGQLMPDNYFPAEELNNLEKKEDWLAGGETYAGQLAVDVYQKGERIIVKAALAGVKPENVEINLNNDTLTIKGKRAEEHKEEGTDYFIQECYWGGFSRSIILPVDVKQDEVEASFDQGILTISLPISKRSKHTKIEIKEIKK